MWITAKELENMGVASATIYRKTRCGDWVSRLSATKGLRGRPSKEILVSSLPQDLQLQCHRLLSPPAPEPLEETGAPSEEPQPARFSIEQLTVALKRFPLEERESWLAELQRLAALTDRYILINPKRIKDAAGNLQFVAPVLALCEEARCTNQIILAREPRRADLPSPFSLDRWAREFRKDGVIAFLRKPAEQIKAVDKRKAPISSEAAQWINQNWRNFRNPTHLYKATAKKAKERGWTLPGKQWFFRRWKELPSVLKTVQLKGQKEYTSRYAPHVPRDFSDLDALQVLCGDHSQRDLTVTLSNGEPARPWLTLWQDLRTGLIWGWHLDVTPSSNTAGIAYANGVRTFGAQPLSIPEQDYFSYVYTDQGKDYRSHKWDGSEITVHKHAFKLEGGVQVLFVQRRVGFLDEIGVKHILARGYNAREKPVERLHRDISEWEENNFEEYCGRDAKNKPDRWRELYSQYQSFKRGRRSESPFIGFDEYREALAGFIAEYNAAEHHRSNLNGARITPIEEYRRLYTTHYEISDDALALLLMKAEKRRIRKNGVQCFQSNWYYWHNRMSEFKDSDVEVRYSDDDYSRVWVFLPNGEICEAQLITPSSLIRPNKQTLGAVAEARAHERRLIRDHSLLTFSTLRGESTEDRVAAQFDDQLEENEAIAAEAGGPARVQRLTRMDRAKLRAVPVGRPVSIQAINEAAPDEEIFGVAQTLRVKEFDFEE